MKTKLSAIVLILTVLFAVSEVSYGCYDPPPYVFITCPEDGAPFVEGNDITIDANASDSSPGYITKVEFYKGTTLLGEDTNYPYSFVWNDANDSPDGNLMLTARAYDNAEQSADSTPVQMLSPPTIWYVDDDAPAGGDGEDWTTARKYLRDVLDDDSIAPGDEIRVAGGTYKPDRDIDHQDGTGDRTATFQLVSGIPVIGGYAGFSNPTNPDERDIAHYQTTLSGDIGAPDNDSDNSYHVVKGVDDAVLDGFVITKGHADGSGDNSNGAGIYCDYDSPTIANCFITDNNTGNGGSGAGMYNYYSNPTVTNCTFSYNSAQPSSGNYGGGGIFNEHSSPNVSNCAFTGNYSKYCGGGMNNYSYSSPKVVNCVFTKNEAMYGGGMENNLYSNSAITNCTFFENSATSTGGGMDNYSQSSPTITNCILWGNTSTTGPQINGTATVNFSDIQDGWTGAGTGNIDPPADPCFVDTSDPEGLDNVFGTSDDGLRIMAYSKCIDRADSTAADFPETDMTGRRRFDVLYVENLGIGIADIGAYESPTVWFVRKDTVAGDDGYSWDTAFDDLQDALAIPDLDDGNEIWVAAGTYNPGEAQTDSFLLVGNVGLYGGFTGTRGIRNWTINKTILSGDIGVTNKNSDNSYHVVTGADNSIIDGFTIADGNANGLNFPNWVGGGIYCGDGASPTIKNCVISKNNSIWFGGGLYISGGSPTITNCIFKNNRANESGGGAYVGFASAQFTNCVFSENTIVYPSDIIDGGGGMSIWLSSLPVIIKNCVFSRNQGLHGSAIQSMQNSSSNLEVTNCTFSNNYDLGYGTIYNYSSNPIITNCILWGTAQEIYNSGSTPDVTYCDIADETYSGEGNIHTDPCFANVANPEGPDGVFGTWDDGLRIMAYSHCVDSADGSKASTRDIIGRARVDVPYVENIGTGVPDYVDIGAYESPTVWFVKRDTPDGDDGQSWDTAFDELKTALNISTNPDLAAGDEIWVAAGIYKPGAARTNSFVLVENVSLYGGFTGIGGVRNWLAHKTYLSGDIGAPDNDSDNSYHVVKGVDDAVLDGFVITKGHADGSGDNSNGAGIYCDYDSPTIANCFITDNNTGNGGSGAGMYNYYSNPTVTNCTFSYNSAQPSSGNYGGGGIFNEHSSPNVSNCAFTGNYSKYCGGGMNNYSYSSPKVVNCVFTKNEAMYGGGMENNLYSNSAITNCTFFENSATSTGGGMDNYSQSSPTITNCILWGNTSTTGPQINGTATVNFSDIQDGWTGAGTGNIDPPADPCFVDTSNPEGPDGVFGTWDDGLCITTYSKCIDRADGNQAPARDITGRARADVPYVENLGTGVPDYVDIGAYESPRIWFVNDDTPAPELDRNGNDWDHAFKYLQDALAVAEAGDQIWVAGGTYKPDQSTTYPDGSGLKEETFQLKSGVGLYGGFAGINDIRDIVAYETILSGDLAGDDGSAPYFGNYGENSYHVVTGSGTDATAILDGFTIEDGHALDPRTAPPGAAYGAGMYNDNGSPTVKNCIFRNNFSCTVGGAVENYGSSPTFTNCIFSENLADFYGSAIDGGGSSSTITNCVFTNNDGFAISSSAAKIVNCTFFGNLGNIYGADSSIITNCIFWGDSSGISCFPTITYSDIKGGYPGVGNIDSDPCFADPGAYNLRLRDNSPCINVGDNSAVPESVTTDLDGNPRIMRLIVDMGAYESPWLQPPLPYIVVACSGRGTVVRIDTRTGAVLGEYQSAPDGRGRNPSRTTVDLIGNAWIGNRDESSGSKGSAIKIGLVVGGTRCDSDGTPNPNGDYLKPPFEYNTCIDKDGDGLIKTSRGLGDIRSWSNTDGADDNGGVSTADDEAILLYVRVNGTNVRHVSVDKDNNVWVGGYSNNAFDLLNGDTGTILDSFDVGLGGYGGLVDRDGILWASGRNPSPYHLLRYDIAQRTWMNLSAPGAYGLAVDTEGFIWHAQYNLGTIYKRTPDGASYEEFDTGGGGGDRGVAVTPVDNDVWVANSGGSSVSRLDNSGNLLGVITVGSTPTGVAVDADGKVWVTNMDSHNAMRIDPDLGTYGEVDLTVSLGSGASPYNYSDMTGIMARYVFCSSLNISSDPSSYGNVVYPGEGIFTFSRGSKVHIIAKPEPGFQFVEWTGSAVDAGKVENPYQSSTTVTVDADYTLVANFD